MARKMRVFLSYTRGVGSILELAPSPSYQHLVPRAPFNERLQADFQRVGDALRHGIDTWNEETTRDGQATSFHAAG